MTALYCVPIVDETGWTCERCGYRSALIPRFKPVRRCQASPEQIEAVPPVEPEKKACDCGGRRPAK